MDPCVLRVLGGEFFNALSAARRSRYPPPRLPSLATSSGAERGGVVGELDAVAAAALEDLQREAVVPRIRDQNAVALPQAQVIPHLVGPPVAAPP